MREGTAGVRTNASIQQELLATAHPVHPSLVRPVLYLGVERTVIALEGTLCLALLFGVGVHLLTLGLVALVLLVIHPTLVWVTGKDAQATEVYVRSRAYADYYAPHASIHAPARTPRPSVPKSR